MNRSTPKGVGVEFNGFYVLFLSGNLSVLVNINEYFSIYLFHISNIFALKVSEVLLKVRNFTFLLKRNSFE